MDKDFFKEMGDDSAPIGPYTITELCELYGKNRRTVLGWLKPHKEEIGKREGHHYTPHQVTIIFLRIGPPPKKKLPPQ